MNKLNLKYTEPIPKIDKLEPVGQYYQVDDQIFYTKLDLYTWKRTNRIKDTKVFVHKIYVLNNF